MDLWLLRIEHLKKIVEETCGVAKAANLLRLMRLFFPLLLLLYTHIFRGEEIELYGSGTRFMNLNIIEAEKTSLLFNRC